MTRLTRSDVAVMQAAALLFPGLLPPPSDSPAANLGHARIPAEGLALIEEIEAIAMDHAGMVGGDLDGEYTYGMAVEDAMSVEQAARAMTLACPAAIDAFVEGAHPSWIPEQLRCGKRRLDMWAEFTTLQRAWVMGLDGALVGEGVDVPVEA